MSGNTSLSTSKLLLPHLVNCLKKRQRKSCLYVTLPFFSEIIEKDLVMSEEIPVVTFTEFKQDMSNKKSAENYFIQSHYHIRKTLAPS